jgi:hypothetical protein
MNLVRVSKEFELSELELARVNYCKNSVKLHLQGKLDLLRVSAGVFELCNMDYVGVRVSGVLL